MTIKQARLQSGITQAELAKKVGTTQQQVARWESGGRKPKVEVLFDIAQACGIDPISFMPKQDQKIARAESESGLSTYPSTCEDVFSKIPEKLSKKLSAGQLAVVAKLIDESYHAGRVAAGAEVIDGDYVWVDLLQRGFNLDDLRKLPVDATHTV